MNKNKKKTGNFNRCVIRAVNQVAKEVVFQKMFGKSVSQRGRNVHNSHYQGRNFSSFKQKIHQESLTWIRREPHGGGDVGPEGGDHGEGGGGVHQGGGGSGHDGAADTHQHQQGRQHRDHQAYLSH
jgi:hypothetical protein